VPKNATNADIKKAFRKKSRKAHPDRDGGSTAAQSEINVAYKLLTSPDRRARFDQTGDGSAQAIPPLEAQARNAICRFLMQGIAQLQEGHDLILFIRTGLQHERGGCTKKISDTKNAMKKFERARKRLKGPPDNFLIYAINDAIRQHQELIARMELDLKMYDAALKMIVDFTYETDQSTQAFVTFTAGGPLNVGAAP
jgi:curved DNA-binding protein CbpA